MSIDVMKFLSVELGLGPSASAQLVRTAPERYAHYTIPKRTGGNRNISQPSSELKIVQRAVVEQLLGDLPIHPAATAYARGTSIRMNAARHAENGPILKFDFKEFFPSLTEYAWISYCKENRICDHSNAIALGRLLFMRPPGARILRLSIGAPSSPFISNVLLYQFDRTIAERVGNHYVAYTRYADDMTFSANRTGYLTVVEKILRKTISDIHLPKLKINEGKTVLATKKYRREVTGLILTNDNRVSLGRSRKRDLRARLHHFLLGNLDIDESVRLAGHMAFAKDVEPEFYTRMERVYGAEILEKLKQSVKGYRRPKFRGGESGS
jgi:hypothetical protein